MNLKPPIEPMEAETARKLPVGQNWQYEPKWDGFRCLAFKSSGDVYLQSRNSKPLGRYFPDVVETLRALPAKQFVLDGELVIPVERRLDFDQLQLRLHPAASRVKKLAEEFPASYVVFDLLADTKGDSQLNKPLMDRRLALENTMEEEFAGNRFVRLSPMTLDAQMAARWLAETNYSLDGVVAKGRSCIYRGGQRDGMVKVKNFRSADCVVGGFRLSSGGDLVASLLLGLYDKPGRLNHVGHISGFKAQDKRALTKRLLQLEGPPGFTGQAPGGPSRWDPERTGEYRSLPPEMVVEVRYDHFSGGRFRHGASFQRWRTDKEARDCTEDQIHFASDLSFDLLLTGER